MCTKVRYDKRDAQTALNNALVSKKKRRKEKRIYYCEACKAWHLTSKENEKKPDIQIAIKHKDKWIELMNNKNE
jgi:hypothetical protein